MLLYQMFKVRLILSLVWFALSLNRINFSCMYFYRKNTTKILSIFQNTNSTEMSSGQALFTKKPKKIYNKKKVTQLGKPR